MTEEIAKNAVNIASRCACSPRDQSGAPVVISGTWFPLSIWSPLGAVTWAALFGFEFIEGAGVPVLIVGGSFFARDPIRSPLQSVRAPSARTPARSANVALQCLNPAQARAPSRPRERVPGHRWQCHPPNSSAYSIIR